jgi:predicted HD superfamily hydrolase involved in NAD metabolism
MKELLKELLGGFPFSGDLKMDSMGLLNSHNKLVVAEHTGRVAEEAKRLAGLFGEDGEAAETAGLLHDISGIIPKERGLEFAEALNIEILPEERPVPFILHQKLSAVLAEQIFHVTDPRILSAISCHTTLKKGARPIDLILFVADKLQWDQTGTPPYLAAMQEGLEKSLKHGAFAFVKHLIGMKEELPVLHPWLVEAYEDLKGPE